MLDPALVPKVVATLVSYAAERQMVRADEQYGFNTDKDRQRRSGSLCFKTEKGRPSTLSHLTLLCPSFTLPELGDPLALAVDSGGHDLSSLDQMFNEVDTRIRERLNNLEAPLKEGPFVTADQAWYWSAPLLLDLQAEPEAAKQ